MVWSSPPESVLVLKTHSDHNVNGPFLQLVTWLVQDMGVSVFVEKGDLWGESLSNSQEWDAVRRQLLPFGDWEDTNEAADVIDLVICLGGDATVLHASALFQTRVPLLMAFGVGDLGCLAPFQLGPDLQQRVSEVIQGCPSVCLRYRLDCALTDGDGANSDRDSVLGEDSPDTGKDRRLVLNQVVLNRGMSCKMSSFDIYIGSRVVTSVQGDGLIVSTPTGSTAYSVWAGASMVHPSTPGVLITPICPHSLSFRPIIVPAGVDVRVKLCGGLAQASTCLVSFDGMDRIEMTEGQILHVTTAIHPLPSICSRNLTDDWFDSLAYCLHWNTRRVQKPMESHKDVHRRTVKAITSTSATTTTPDITPTTTVTSPHPGRATSQQSTGRHVETEGCDPTNNHTTPTATSHNTVSVAGIKGNSACYKNDNDDDNNNAQKNNNSNTTCVINPLPASEKCRINNLNNKPPQSISVLRTAESVNLQSDRRECPVSDMPTRRIDPLPGHTTNSWSDSTGHGTNRTFNRSHPTNAPLTDDSWLSQPHYIDQSTIPVETKSRVGWTHTSHTISHSSVIEHSTPKHTGSCDTKFAAINHTVASCTPNAKGDPMCPNDKVIYKSPTQIHQDGLRSESHHKDGPTSTTSEITKPPVAYIDTTCNSVQYYSRSNNRFEDIPQNLSDIDKCNYKTVNSSAPFDMSRDFIVNDFPSTKYKVVYSVRKNASEQCHGSKDEIVGRTSSGLSSQHGHQQKGSLKTQTNLTHNNDIHILDSSVTLTDDHATETDNYLKTVSSFVLDNDISLPASTVISG